MPDLVIDGQIYYLCMESKTGLHVDSNTGQVRVLVCVGDQYITFDAQGYRGFVQNLFKAGMEAFPEQKDRWVKVRKHD